MSDIAIRVRGLLDFVQQSVEEGLQDSTQQAECFGEAGHAVRILQKTLLKEDEFRHAQLALLWIFHTNFVRISENENRSERDRYMKEALEKIGFGKTLFDV